jgi:hypothetical protein
MAAAAAAAAAQLEAQLQLQALHDHILPMVGFSNVGVNPNQRQTNRFTTLTQLPNLALYQYLEFEQVKLLIKRFQTRYPNENLGVLVNNNLTGLIWYVKDLARRGQVVLPDEVVPGDIFDGYNSYKAYVANKEKGENISKLPKYDDKGEFDEWFERVTDVLNMIYGSYMCPLAYVIRLDQPAGWDPDVDARTDNERLVYQLALNGPEYNNDNQEVFKLLKNAVNGTEAQSYIEDYVVAQDGRGAMMELRRRFEGPNANETRCTKALSQLESLVYKNERETPFEGLVNKLNRAYVTLRKYGGQDFTDIMKVDALAKRFINSSSQNLTLKISLEQMKAMYRANYREAVAYMSSKIGEINAANRSITGNPRRVSQATNESSISVRDRNGNIFTSFHDVDLRSPTRHYTEDEMTALGFRGRAILEELRRLENERNGHARGGRGRGGGFGRGNGGYGRGGRGRGYGRGRGRGRGYGGRYGGRGNNNNGGNGNNDGNNRQVNAADRNTAAAPDAAASAPPQNQGNNNNQNNQASTGNRGNQNGAGYGQH